MNCGDCNADSAAFKHCAACRRERAKQAKIYRDQTLARGLCVERCGRPIGLTKTGRPSKSRCTECLADLRKALP